MIPRINRLSKEKDFERIFREGKEYRLPNLTIKLLANKQSFSRFGIIVSAKVAKKAVGRNRLRRQLRAILQARLAEIKPEFDVILIAKPSLLNLNFPALEKTVDNLLKKAHINV